jgi:hypothetical protein
MVKSMGRTAVTTTLVAACALGVVTVPRVAAAQGVATHGGTFSLQGQGGAALVYVNMTTVTESVMVTICANPGGAAVDWSIWNFSSGVTTVEPAVAAGKCVTFSSVEVPNGEGIVVSSVSHVGGTYTVSTVLVAQGVQTQHGEFTLTSNPAHFFYRNTGAGGGETVVLTVCATSGSVSVGTGHDVPPIVSFSPFPVVGVFPNFLPLGDVGSGRCRTYSIVHVPSEFGIAVKRFDSQTTVGTYIVSRVVTPDQGAPGQ